MHFSKYLKAVLLLVVFITTKSLYAQLSKTHYIPPLSSAEFGNANPESQYMYLSTPSLADVSYTIKPVGQPPSSYISGVVSNASPIEIYLGTGNGQLFVASSQTSTITNKGYVIEAEDVIYVSVRMNAGNGAQAGALVSKGVSALGTTFRVGSFTNLGAFNQSQDNYLNFVSVMATEDNTQVTFSNLPAGLDIDGDPSNTIPVTVLLNENESYIIATNCADAEINEYGLIGSLVSSDKNIVVNCGSANGSFGDASGNGRDYGIDQIVDVSKVGKEYIFVRGNGADDWENILIVAHSDNTSISINGNAPITIINAGEYYVIEGDNYNGDGNMYVETSEDVFAYQGIGGLNSNGTPAEANQGLFFVPPLSCEARGNIDNIANIDDIGSTTFLGGLSIVTKVGATVTINNLPISSFTTQGPNPVSGNPNYETYKVTGLTGNVSVQCEEELYCAYFNYNGAATSGSFYSGFPSIPEINYDADFEALGNCIPNITLSAANTQYFDSYEWYFDDGSGFVNLNISAPEYTPTTPGNYKLIGEIFCSGLILESDEVPVSICPDDIDNDGIIDNIDLDNDNDGILNCVESNGNATVNLLNINLPQIVLQDGTINPVIVTGTFSENNSSGNVNTFSGDSSGRFTSVVNSDTSSDSEYNIAFNETVHVLLSEDLTITHNITTGEYFTVKITPVNKNITLLDPDDRLLVDTNFDGVFETGVTQISGSEIRFQVNSSPLGSTPYEFSANEVSGLSFMHHLSNVTNASTFRAIISLSCFKLDSDLDGIENALDLDSDNDGIPDFIESLGNNYVSLTGVDDDNNGVDDVFDINATPIDTDSDGVTDYLDLDSDNDGIHDLYETGQLGLLSDTDLNGVIDWLNPSDTNGWDNNAETSPDSGVIGYTLNDLDADNIFSYLDLDSDGDDCSDVIEAGFSDANNDDLLGDYTVQVDAFGLVNNVSDGYTIPNVNYLISAPIVITSEPEDTSACEFSNTMLSIIATDVNYFQWEVSLDGINWNTISDDAVYNGSAASTLNLSNVPLSYNNYRYRVFLNRDGNSCGLYSQEITLTVNLLPVAGIAPNMQLCDDDNNGTMPFDLTLQNNSINNASGMTITYHTSQTDADTGNAPVAIPFETGNTTIFARVENNLNTTCYATSSFNLEVYDSAFPANAIPLQECDDTSIGTDTDGLKIFDLTQNEVEILNNQSPSDFTLTYFTDSAYLNQISTPTAYPISNAGNQTIYVRMTNNSYTSCYTDTSFVIEVLELPTVNNPSNYSQCDDQSNDGQASFNLTLNSIKQEINPDYLSEGLTFTYFETQNAAETNGTGILTPSSYTDALGFVNETVWVRVENPNGCFRVVPLILEVNPSSAVLGLYNPISIYQCDDGNDFRDGVSTFDLTDIHNHISTAIFPSINVTVHFYENLMDAELENNEILDIANHQNTNSPHIQSIWVRVKSDLGNNCLGLEEFPNLLIVEELPFANSVTINRQCDDDFDGAYPFDVSTIENTVLGMQSISDVSITYYDNIGSPLLDFTGNPVTSPLPNNLLLESQIITIRVTNNNTADPNGPCYDETTLEFIVDEQPIANPISPQIVCDGDSGDIDNDGVFPFDTSTFENTIRGTQTGMDIYFDYFDETGNLISDSPTLPNPLVSSNQTIAIEVVNPINQICSAFSTIDLVVNSLPEFTIEEEEIVCTSDPTFSVTLSPVQNDPFEVFNYEWEYQDGTILSNTSTLSVSTPGDYFITLINPISLCSRTRMVSVKASELANITLENITIVDFSENNSITINNPDNLGSGVYQFALESEDGMIIFPYQDSSVFNNVRAGIYNLLVKDDICGVTELEIYVIGSPKFFTPNGDGYNDTWNIKGINSDFQPQTIIYIFDRYGKLIKQLNPTGNGWDGTINGYDLPTNDYWYKVFLQDGREFMGHFTLKR